jgi:hypothetical protein
MKIDSLARKIRNNGTFMMLFVLFAAITGCSSTIKQVKEFKQHHSQQQFQWLSEQPIDCEVKHEGCNQLHLIKGDACFRLAKQEIAPLENYQSAITHLQLGIQQTKNWQLQDLHLDRTQTYINLCESLRNLQDLQSGEESQQTGRQFLAAAEEFYALEKDSPAATFFVVKARLRQIMPEILQKQNKVENCQKLAEILERVEQALTTESEFKANLNLLKNELAMAKNTLECE